MLAWIKRKRNAAAVAVIAVALVVGYGVSAAQAVLLPSGHHTWGSFAACIAKSNGAMRLVGANASACKSTETPVKWNSAGSPNGTGKTGPKGDTGEQGEQGPAGEKGEQGLKGDTGAKGEAGAAGEKGDAGAPGAPGADGADGKDGADGVVAPESDGTYDTLPAGDGTEVKTFTVDCASDKVALGGGFSVDFPQHRPNVRFVGSTPAKFTEIPGDAEGSVVPHGWEIQVINDGPETSVRPWVVCAEIAAPAE